MGLDAVVYCGCYEKGQLSEPPPPGTLLRVETDSSLADAREDRSLESDLAFDQWREHRACEHPGGILVHHRLGNISLIGLLRVELEREASRFPVLLTKVLYSGTHTGDDLGVEAIPALQSEVRALADFKCGAPEAEAFMTEFRRQMLELAATALSVTKPISF